MTTKPAPARRQRTRAFVIVDIVVGVLLTLISAWYMFVQLGLQFTSGLEGFGVPLKVLSVLSWFIGTAFFIVFAVRKRVAFYWPLVGLVLMYASAAIILVIAGASK
jgi:hypothetical protein